MALTATFAADFSAFEKSINQATVHLQVFDRATKTSARSLTRELESISGQKVAAEAARMSEAVKRLGGDFGVAGGLAKLLPDELKRVTATLDQAAQKAQLLGEKLPTSLQKMREEIAKLPKPVNESASGFASLSGIVGKLGPLLPVASIAGAGTAIIGMGKAAFESAGQIADLSSRTGLSIEGIQRMQAVATQTGTSLEAFTSAAFKLGVNVAEGTTKAREAVAALGLSYTELKNQKPEEQFAAVIKALEGVDNQQERNRIGVALFGRQFSEIAAAVQEGYSKIANAATVSADAQIQALAAAGDAWDKFVDDAKANIRSFLGNAVIGLQTPQDIRELTDAQREMLTEGIKNGENLILVWQRIRGVIPKDFKLPGASPADAGAMRDYVKELSAVLAKVRELDPATKVQLDAAIRLGAAQDELTDRFGLSNAELRVYGQHVQETAAKKKEMEAAAKAAAKELAAFWKEVDRLNRNTLPAFAGLLDKISTDIGYVPPLLSSSAIQTRAFGGALLQANEAGLGWKKANGLLDNLESAAAETQKLASERESLRGLAQAFSQLADVTGSELVRSLAETSNQMVIGAEAGALFRDSLEQLSAGGLENTIAGLQSLVTAAIAAGGALASATDKAGRGNRALSGAAVGAKIGGSIVPGYGHLIGAGVGALVGALRNPAFEDVMNRVGRDYGVQISEGLARGIADTAKKLFGGDRQAAELFSLGDIVQEAGGLDASNIDRFTRRLRDVFSLIETGQFTATQGTRLLQEEWDAFAEAGTDASGRLSEGLREILVLARASGLEVRALSDYTAGQATAAVEGFNASAEGLVAPWVALGDEIASTGRAIRDFNAETGQADDLTALLDEQRELLRRQAEEARRAGSALADMGIIAIATYGAAITAGESHAAAIRAAAPGLGSLASAYEALGLNIEDAGLSALLLQGSLSEKNPQLVAGVDGLSQSMIALHNIGLLNADTFGAMQRTGAEMYTRLQGEVSALGGGTRDALLPMQGYLQEAAAQAALLGIPLDDNTQMLIDQSKELGIWRDKGKSNIDIMVDAMGDLVGSVRDLVNELRGIPRTIDTTVTTRYDTDGTPPTGVAGPSLASRGGFVGSRGVEYFSGGGFVPRGTDTVPAMLTPGEMVFSREDTKHFLRALRDGGSGGSPSVHNVRVDVGGSQFLDFVIDTVGQRVRVRGGA